MSGSIHDEIYAGLDEVTKERCDFIRKAFSLIPKLDGPRILDVGCGRGGPTVELAKLSGGVLTGVDIDAEALRHLVVRANREGLSDRIRVRNCSMLAMDFDDESFDVIWAEASIHVIGFEEGLQAWRRLLVPGGFLVVHEVVWLRQDPPPELAACWRGIFPCIRTAEAYAEAIPRFGYSLEDHFALPEEFWSDNYFGPMEARIGALKVKYRDDGAAMQALLQVELEIELSKKYSGWFGSAYLIMAKIAQHTEEK
jgi:SAM-dependent methyltransferase